MSSALSALDEPIRRRLFDYVRQASEPVAREDAAAAAGISRSLAAYHLDKLAEHGLLTTAYARPEGRSGPGAGRPAKLYSPRETELSVPEHPCDYRCAPRSLAHAAEPEPSAGISMHHGAP